MWVCGLLMLAVMVTLGLSGQQRLLLLWWEGCDYLHAVEAALEGNHSPPTKDRDRWVGQLLRFLLLETRHRTWQFVGAWLLMQADVGVVWNKDACCCSGGRAADGF
jgi:hypothetical protein